MFIYDSKLCLPSSEELPDCNDKPVDNELQVLIPGLLKAILAGCSPEERAEQEQQRAEQAEQRLQSVLEQLRQQGMDIDNL